MRFSADKAYKSRAATKKTGYYGSQWAPGDTLRVIYPIFWDEETNSWQLLVAAVWGYKVSDMKALNLKTAFIPALCEFDEDGTPIGTPDIAYRFSQIAQAFVSGQYRSEMNSISQKPWPTKTAEMEAIKAVEAKFDTKNSMRAVKPVISRAMLQIMTECVTVKMKDHKPDPDTAALVTQPLNDNVLRALMQLVTEDKFTPVHVDQETDYIEVEWNYPITNNNMKGQSAMQAKPVGLIAEERLASIDPDSWNKIKATVNTIATESEIIQRRSTKRLDETKIEQAITAYSFTNSQYLDSLDMEQDIDIVERLCKGADIIHDLSLEKAITNTEILKRLEEAGPTESNSETAPMPNPVPDGPTLQSLLNTDTAETQAINNLTESIEPAPASAPAPATEPAPAPAPASTTPTNVTRLSPAAATAINPSAMADMTDGELSEVEFPV